MSTEVTEQLLKPRYKVIGLYPFCPYSIGQLIKYSDDGNWFLSVFILYDSEGSRVEKSIYHRIETVDHYPHLFQKLEWWQERKPEEMPEYVKYSRGVYKVKNWHYSPGGEILFDILNWKNEKWWSSQGGNYWMRHVGLLPATLEEYNQYQSSIKHL